MKRLAALLIAALLAVAVAAPASAAPRDPFRGAWHAVDVDDSNMVMLLYGIGSTRHLLWLDDFTSVCGGGLSLITGSGTVSGVTFAATVSVHCANGTPVDPLAVEWTYDATTNQLHDSVGVTWDRF
jgi:hypothetical protein